MLVVISNIKKRVREECTPVTKIDEEEITKNVTDKGLHLVTAVPRFHNVEKQLYATRYSSLGIQIFPKHQWDIVIHEKCKAFFCDSMMEDRIFFLPEMVKISATNSGSLKKGE